MADLSNYFSPAPAAVGGNPSQMPYGPTNSLPAATFGAGNPMNKLNPTALTIVGLVVVTFILFHVGE